MGRERSTEEVVAIDAVTALDVCGKSVYPVIHRLLQTLTKQPVSNRFSRVKRKRRTISQEKLSALASKTINNKRIKPKDAEEVLNKLAREKKKNISAI